MLFVLTCTDREGALALRQQTRPAHLEYLDKYAHRLILAGPLTADGQPIGSLLVIEAAGQQEAAEFAAQDPYAKAGLFSRVEVHPFRAVFKDGKRAE